MKWIKNIENITKVNIPGECPYCGSPNTEYTANKVEKNFGYAVIWCNNCKKACHISRIEISDKTTVNKKIPIGLSFT